MDAAENDIIDSTGGSTGNPSATHESLAIFEPGAGGQWFVLHTKSRQEKALADELRQFDIPCFLPVMSVVRYHGSRKRRVDLPMFPGYVFLRGVRQQAFRADRTRRLAHIINVTDQARLHAELHSIAIALAAGAQVDMFPYLRAGVRVEVRSGPLRGLKGVVEDRAKRDRIILRVEILSTAVSLQVDATTVDVID